MHPQRAFICGVSKATATGSQVSLCRVVVLWPWLLREHLELLSTQSAWLQPGADWACGPCWLD